MMRECSYLTIDISRNTLMYHALRHTVDPIAKETLSHSDEMAKEMKLTNGANGEAAEEYSIEFLKKLQESVSPENIQYKICAMILCQNVQAFDYFMVQLLTKTFMQHKGILNSKENVIQVSEVLQCETVEEIIKRIVERKIHNMGYDSFDNTIEYFNKNLKLGFDTNMSEYLDTCEMFLARNIIVHNNSYINEIYLQKTKRKDLQLGALYPLADEDFIQRTAKLVILGQALEKQFYSHFNLQ